MYKNISNIYYQTVLTSTNNIPFKNKVSDVFIEIINVFYPLLRIIITGIIYIQNQVARETSKELKNQNCNIYSSNLPDKIRFIKKYPFNSFFKIQNKITQSMQNCCKFQSFP